MSLTQNIMTDTTEEVLNNWGLSDPALKKGILNGEDDIQLGTIIKSLQEDVIFASGPIRLVGGYDAVTKVSE